MDTLIKLSKSILYIKGFLQSKKRKKRNLGTYIIT